MTRRPSKGQPDRLKPNTPGWRKRMHVHAHNQRRGSIEMARANIRIVASCPSMTEGTRALAASIAADLDTLARMAVSRVDPDFT